MTCANNWSIWRKLAEGDEYFPETHDGPACYQLAIGDPRRGNIRMKYVGYSGNLQERVRSYGQHGANNAFEIDEAIEEGYCIFYRYKKCATENQACECKQRQLTRLRNRSRYMWNRDWPQ